MCQTGRRLEGACLGGFFRLCSSTGIVGVQPLNAVVQCLNDNRIREWERVDAGVWIGCGWKARLPVMFFGGRMPGYGLGAVGNRTYGGYNFAREDAGSAESVRLETDL